MSQSQRGCIDVGLRVIAVLMAVGLMLSLPLALAGRSFGRVLFRPNVLTAVLSESVLESGVLKTAIRENLLTRAEFDPAQGQGDDLGRYLKYLSPAQREEIYIALIPPNWIEQQINQVLGDLYAWLDDDRTLPVITLDLQPIKTNLLRGGINRFVDSVVDSWPSCKPEQVEVLQGEFIEGGRLPETLCEPPEPLRGRMVDLVTIAFEEQTRQLPDSAPLIERSASVGEFIALKEQLRFIRALMLWGWMLPLSLLGLIMAFAVRAWSDFGRWWGVPLLLGGVSTLILAIFLSGIREDLISGWVSGVGSGVFLQSILAAALEGMYRAGLRPIWLLALFVIGSGWMLRRLVRRVNAKPQKGSEVGPGTPAGVVTRVLPAENQASEPEEGIEPPAGIFG
ncbi:MAG: hypothetical protein E4G99_07030 [Anaerolineales bacterium]|nr:MAG: hypothetical protein E4G99_07030 [Anaerolineales bacterium]